MSGVSMVRLSVRTMAGRLENDTVNAFAVKKSSSSSLTGRLVHPRS